MRMNRLGAAWVCVAAACALAQGGTPLPHSLPNVQQLMKEVVAHQKQVEKVRENYTYSSLETTQDLDSSGRVVKTESVESEVFFVNTHAIERVVKKNGQPLNEHDAQKETERVTKAVEKAEKTPPGQAPNGDTVSIGQLLAIMNVSAPRREMYRGRPAIVFDFAGRRDAKTHGLAEDASKKLKGTIWIDEADREVAHLEVTFTDNFHVGGGLLANIEKGTSFRFDQEPVGDGLWLPTGGEGMVQARVLLFKNMRQHVVEKDWNYKRFQIQTNQVQTKQETAGTKDE